MRSYSKISADWWDYTTLDRDILDAAAKLTEALHYFDHCNDALAEAVALAKGE